MDSHRDWHGTPPAPVAAPRVRPLAELHRGARGMVTQVLESATTIGDAQDSTLARRLTELGFVPGERLEIIGEVRPGGDPMAVRIGSSMFALRRREACAVLVQLEEAATLAAAAP